MPTEGENLPSQFGRYELVARLALGGMAEVFRARISASHGFEKILVIKRILPHLAVDKNFVSMFIDEAKLTAQLLHPKIVQVTDFGEVDGQYFIALEFIDGFDALALLRTCAHKRIRLPIHLGVFVVVEMLDALDYAHNAVDAEGRPMKLVHRDISPSNVFISRRGDVKLGDFGIAHATERESKTQAGTLKGKYGYMSPEQVTGSVLDGRSDVFAVGIVLAEMLMGRRLFTAANDLDVLLMVRDGRLERLDKYCKDIPASLDLIVRKSLKKALPERYQSAAEFRDALADWLFQAGKRVSPNDLGAFTKDLFDDSPEALRRLQDQGAKLKVELDAMMAGGRIGGPGGGGGGAPPAAIPAAPAPAMPGMSRPRREPVRVVEPEPEPEPQPEDDEEPEDETEQTDAEAEPAPEPPRRRSSARMSSTGSPQAGGRRSQQMRVRRPTPPEEEDEDEEIDNEPSVDIALDEDDLEPVSRRPKRPKADPKITAALESALANTLSVVDLEQWGGDSDQALPSAGGGGGEPHSPWTPAPAPSLPPAMPSGGGPVMGSGMNPAMTGGRGAVGQFVSGAPRRAPDTTGDLGSVSPMRIFANLAIGAETGMVRFDLPPYVKEVFVAAGAPQSLNSSVPGEKFGEYLVAQRIIRPADLDQALARLPQFSGKLGDTLVGLGIMKPMEVFRLLSQQVRERVMNVFGLDRGGFAYFRGVSNPHDAFPLNLDPFEILGSGVLTLPQAFLEAQLGPVLDVRPRASQRPRVAPDSFRLGPTPREVMGMLDGTRSLRQWMAHFSGGEEQLTFLRTVYLLIETDLVQVR